MIEVISFDLDDTLWDNEFVIQRAKSKLFQRLVETYPIISHSFEQTEFDQLILKILKNNPDSYNLTALKKLQIKTLLAQFNLPFDRVDTLFDYYFYWRNQVNFFPDVIETLQQLSKDYRLASATNGNVDIKQLGLDGLFHYSVSAFVVKASKPSIKIYQNIIKTLQVPAQNIIHIGDSLTNDIGASIEAGMKAIWFNPKHQKSNFEDKNFIGQFTEYQQLTKLILGSKA